jgi:hypothetical protein
LRRIANKQAVIERATNVPVADKGSSLEFPLFYGSYWAIFHIPLGNLAHFVIGGACPSPKPRHH